MRITVLGKVPNVEELVAEFLKDNELLLPEEVEVGPCNPAVDIEHTVLYIFERPSWVKGIPRISKLYPELVFVVQWTDEGEVYRGAESAIQSGETLEGIERDYLEPRPSLVHFYGTRTWAQKAKTNLWIALEAVKEIQVPFLDWHNCLGDADKVEAAAQAVRKLYEVMKPIIESVDFNGVFLMPHEKRSEGEESVAWEYKSIGPSLDDELPLPSVEGENNQ
jgi:hypothetical protein